MLEFNHWKISTKLTLMAVFFVVLFLIFGWIARDTLEQVRVKGKAYNDIILTKDLIADVLPPPEYIIESFLIVNRMEGEKDPERLDAFERKLKELHRKYDERHEYWVQHLRGPELERMREPMLVQAYEPAVRFFDLVEGRFLDAIHRGDHAGARRLARGELARQYEAHRTAIDEVVRLSEQANRTIEDNADQLIQRRNATMLGLGLGIILLATGLTIWISSTITRPLRQVVGTITGFTTEFSSTVEEQERMAAQQASAINETTATMEELGASSRLSAEQADAASAGARQALTVAEDGTRTVRQTLEGMEGLKERVEAIAEQILRLSEQTGQIGNITSLVSDLANQTNLLALNAAVEAARAGEHGKGFAVVAAEIRKLADQSKKSAERIHALVSDIQQATNSTVMVTEEGTKTVEKGTQLAQRTGEAFNGLALSISSTFESMQQITLNAKQQAAAVNQVVDAMASLNGGARETAAGITQTRAGMQHLNEGAKNLATLV
jgi:methyl-accepting chemotaxis protein